MWGLLTVFAGLLMAVAGVVWLVGPWGLIAGGVVVVIAGLLVDFDRVKEPQRGKRSQSAS